jgi:hypothetical protein
MSVADLCIYFIIGILSVGYPILLQVISHLDEKYSSIIIVDLFRKELRWKLFKIFFISSLVLVGLYALTILYTLNICLFINLFTTYLLFVSTSLLVVTFLMFIGRIITYYTPSKIVAYFIEKENDANNDYFKALGDILYFSVESNKDAFARIIHEHITKLFAQHRKKHKGQSLIYPNTFYTLIINTVSRLAPLKERRFGFLEHLTVGGAWLIGNKAEISEDTFSCLWRCLTIAVNFERDDMVMQYWPVAHQHFVSELDRIHPETNNEDDELKIINQDEINYRDDQRKRFLEFDQALIGLLLYRGRWDCIKRIFRYSTDAPPKYALLPEYMDEVFEMFFKFWDSYHYNFPFIGSKYWYPETEGLNSENLVKYWTGKTAALLFLRQYSIVEYYTYMRPLAYPANPQKKAKKKEWMDNLGHFKQMVEELYKNRELMDSVGLGFLTDEWCDLNKKIKPIDFIQNVIKSVNDAYERSEIENEITENELNGFKESSAKILQRTIQPYIDLFSESIDQQYQGYSIPGVKGLLEKAPFTDDTDADSANHGSIYAQSMSENIKNQMYNYLNYIPRHIQYRLSPEDFFPGIDLLKLDPDQHVVLNFGIDFSFFNGGKSIDGLENDNYKGVKVYELPFYGTGDERRLLILNRSDFPYVFFKDISPFEIKKYHAEKLEPLNIQAAIVDLYRDQKVRNIVLADQDFTVDQKIGIEKQVFISIAMQMIVRLKESMHGVAITPYYTYQGSGIKQTLLKDVKVFQQPPENNDTAKSNGDGQE